MNWISRLIHPPTPESVFTPAKIPPARELVSQGACSLKSAGIEVTEMEFRRLMIRVEFFVPSPTDTKRYVDFWESVFPAMAIELIEARDK
jgi:hypothetical protein